MYIYIYIWRCAVCYYIESDYKTVTVFREQQERMSGAWSAQGAAGPRGALEGLGGPECLGGLRGWLGRPWGPGGPLGLRGLGAAWVPWGQGGLGGLGGMGAWNIGAKAFFCGISVVMITPRLTRTTITA